MGHTLNVHKIHYRQTSDILERIDVAKILLLQDLGKMGNYHGKSLKDIQLEGKEIPMMLFHLAHYYWL